MGVTVNGVGSSEYVRLTGDIETTWRLPYETNDESRFLLAFSDGTLVEETMTNSNALAFASHKKALVSSRWELVGYASIGRWNGQRSPRTMQVR